MPSNTPSKGRWKRWRWMFVAIALIAGGTGTLAWVGNGFAPPDRSPVDPDTPSTTWLFDRLSVDDSGFPLANQIAARTPYDPTSLESIRTAFRNLGSRGIDSLRRFKPSAPENQLDQLLQTALFQGYEGNFIEAGITLDEARTLAESNPKRFAKGLPTLVFLQGIMALRRGEVENCVSCPCRGSCIFPLQPQAIHRQKVGSRQAVKHFTHYLQNRPNDIGVRWLLNVAYMTLGEYPDGVPEPYRLALDPFRSEFDIGRFVDLAPALGLDRLHCSGGAIMDDFDNDGFLDIVETSSDSTVPMAFYHNRGDGTFLVIVP